MVSRLRTTSEYTRARSLLAAPPKSREEAVKAVEAMLSSRKWQVRNVGVKLIGKAGLEQFLPRLGEILVDGREAGIVKRNSADVLGLRGGRDRETIDALVSALKDSYWEVRSRSALALWRLCGPEDGVDESLYELLFGSEHSEVLKRPVIYVDEYLTEKSFEVRGYAAQALGSVGRGEKAFRALVALTTDVSWVVRNQAAVALGELAARERDFYRSALGWVERLDVLCDGSISIFPIRQSVNRLAALLRSGEPDQAQIRELYLHLMEGWHRRI
jgi:HEAT repeat protein